MIGVSEGSRIVYTAIRGLQSLDFPKCPVPVGTDGSAAVEASTPEQRSRPYGDG